MLCVYLKKKMHITFHQSERLNLEIGRERQEKSPKKSTLLRLCYGTILYKRNFLVPACCTTMGYCAVISGFSRDSSQTGSDYTSGYWPNSDIVFMHEMESHKGLKSKRDDRAWLWKQQ